jgi:hypothetical protein
MLRRLIASGLAIGGLTFAQLTPKAKPDDYPAHADAGGVAIAADSLGHSLIAPDDSLFVRDYLVVEVAVYGSEAKPVKIAGGQFTLRINGRTIPLEAASPGAVAASMKYPDWTDHPQFEAQAGPMIIGGQTPVARFPGDNRPYENRVPNPVPPPTVDNPGAPAKPAPSIDDIVTRCALTEGIVRRPTDGYLFFEHPAKKMKSIRKMELLYDGPLGKATLRLR